MIKAIAVDDEPMALQIIERHAKQVPFIDLRAIFSSPAAALDYLKETAVDLVFLDIAMPDLSGLEIAAILKRQTQVVFTTAYTEHALAGFDLAATDYLLKPINFDRFLQACRLAEVRQPAFSTARIRPDPEQRSFPDQRSFPEQCLFVKDGYNWVQIRFDNLLYARGEDNYVRLCEPGRQLLTRMTLLDLQRKLPPDRFLRIHKSFIVALSKIEKVTNHQLIIDGDRLPLSRQFRKELFRRLGL